MKKTFILTILFLGLQCLTLPAAIYNAEFRGVSQQLKDGKVDNVSFNGKTLLKRVAKQNSVPEKTLKLVFDTETRVVRAVNRATGAPVGDALFMFGDGQSFTTKDGKETVRQQFIYPGTGGTAIGSIAINEKKKEGGTISYRGDFQLGLLEGDDEEERVSEAATLVKVITGVFSTSNIFHPGQRDND